MAKFELSINVKYLPEWGVWEGIRELIQNGKDAETEFAAKLVVDWRNGVLRIENDGATLDRSALLFGTTSKGGRADLIGKFGEGLKLGVLALVRAGRTVKIRTGDEVWTPTIARSERCAADVLVFDIKGGNENKKRVRLEIGGVVESEWLDFRTRFLFLRDGRKSDKSIVATTAGDLLTSPEHNGRLYVKGIFVCYAPGLRYGYNYRDAELDRDRKMIESYDRRSGMANILNVAVSQRPDLVEAYLDTLEDIDSDESDGVCTYNLPDGIVVDAAVARFRARYGVDAVPVLTMQDCAEIAHFGVKGIVVTSPMAAILHSLGNAQTVKAKFSKAINRKCSLSELSQEEATNLHTAIEIFERATSASVLSRLDIVEYRDPDLCGLHHGDRISVARRMLASVEDTIAVFVHEIAHDAGKDGDKSHVATIENYWRKVVKYLRTDFQR